MRRTLAFVLTTVVLTVTPLWAQQPPPAQPAPPPAQPAPPPAQPPAAPPPAGPGAPTASIRQIVPGKSLSAIEIGSRISLVLTRFGQPSEVRETPIDRVYLFNRYGISVYVASGTVIAVSTSNSLLKINDTVGPGSRVEDVQTMFGPGFREGTVEAFTGLIYDSRGVAFGLDGKGVAIVLVFKTAGANRVSGLTPGARPPQAPVAGFPNVAGLRPFSAETNYFSLPGYLRWLVFQASGNWITYAEAARVVEEQRAGR